MATRLGNRRAAADAGSGDVDQDLDVLHPERTIELRGRRVTVREYGHIEWLRLLPAAAPLVESIAAMLDAGRAPRYEEALDIIARHADALMPLVRQACDMTPAEFEALNPEEGELVLMTWWGANGRFFVARALNRVAVSGLERKAGASATASSTPPSSPTDTSAPTSADTPSGN